MALSKTTITHTGARLQVIESITNLILQELPSVLVENFIENMTVAERRFLREKMALYKAIIQGIRTKGGDASTADEITRADVGRLYLDAQEVMGHIGEAARKLRTFIGHWEKKCADEGVRLLKATDNALYDLGNLNKLFASLGDDFILPFPNTKMFSCFVSGCFFALKKLVHWHLSQTHSYLNISRLLIITALVKGCAAVRTIAPFGLIILL